MSRKANAERVTIRRATADDLPAILALMRTSLGTGSIPRTEEYWRWKHVNNPFGESPVLLAEADGEVVGLRAFMRWAWQSGRRTVPAVRAVDTATHPDWRGQGIFTRLTLRLVEEMREEGVAFVFNTPNAKSRPGYLKMGWEAVGRPTLWVRPVRPVRLLSALYRGALSKVKGAPPPPIDAEAAAAVLARPAVQALLTAASRTDSRYHTPVDASYLRWRYVDIPDIRYFALARGAAEEGALVVVRSRCRGALRELRICEVVMGPTAAARSNARKLLRRVPRQADVDAVVAMPPAAANALMLLGLCGYVPAPYAAPAMTVNLLAGLLDAPDPRRLVNWRPTVGSIELF